MAVVKLEKRRRKKTPVTGRRHITQQLTLAAAYWLSKKGYGVHVEVGILPWGKRRVDIVAADKRGKNVVICEVKSGLADLRADRKWKEYLPFCNQFYFVFRDTDKPKLLELYPKFRRRGVGVAYLCTDRSDYDHGYGWVYVDIPARKRKMDGTKKKSLICSMAWRGAVYSKRTTKRYRVTIEETVNKR